MNASFLFKYQFRIIEEDPKLFATRLKPTLTSDSAVGRHWFGASPPPKGLVNGGCERWSVVEMKVWAMWKVLWMHGSGMVSNGG
ncbi:hypothetical protein V6N11_084214 [Hibiscus sabdariffa]|uniref:Uncharacterized protein n=1 Tax=Hibiscus sabdariffa TaxID=183260 RepID=A0ABR2QSG3_9ROSI